MPLQMPHVFVCDSHNELPQSKHCVLAVLEQGKPSASDTFRTSMTSQRSDMLGTLLIVKLIVQACTRFAQLFPFTLNGVPPFNCLC